MKEEDNMKKLMILAAVAAMAFGAQAESTLNAYEFILTIENVPTSWAQLSKAAGCYLIDLQNKGEGSKGTIVGYLNTSVFDTLVSDGYYQWDDDKTTRTLIKSQNYADGSNYREITLGNSQTLNGQKFDVASGNMKAKEFGTLVMATSNDGVNKNVTWQVKFDDATGTLPTDSEAHSVEGSYMIVLYDPEAEGEAFYQEFTKVGYNGGSSGLRTISATQHYDPAPVPEPTSAMLLLLGFAGLALKRKQVA